MLTKAVCARVVQTLDHPLPLKVHVPIFPVTFSPTLSMHPFNFQAQHTIPSAPSHMIHKMATFTVITFLEILAPWGLRLFCDIEVSTSNQSLVTR